MPESSWKPTSVSRSEGRAARLARVKHCHSPIACQRVSGCRASSFHQRKDQIASFEPDEDRKWGRDTLGKGCRYGLLCMSELRSWVPTKLNSTQPDLPAFSPSSNHASRALSPCTAVILKAEQYRTNGRKDDVNIHNRN